MVLNGSRRFSMFLSASCWFCGSQWFSQVLVGVVGSQCFSVVLVGFHRFSVVLSGCRMFSVVFIVVMGSQWFS